MSDETAKYRIYHRWNYNTRQYEPYPVLADKYLSSFEVDMKKKVNCCQCLKEITFGEAYTSLEVHTMPLAFGYAVCAECHEKEMERKRRYHE